MGKLLYYFSAILWVFSLFIHLTSLFGWTFPNENICIFIAVISGIVLFIFFFLELYNDDDAAEIRESTPYFNGYTVSDLRRIFKDTPRTIKILTLCCFGYAFLYFIALDGLLNTVQEKNQEYQLFIGSLRRFSVAIMAFSSNSFAFFYGFVEHPSKTPTETEN